MEKGQQKVINNNSKINQIDINKEMSLRVKEKTAMVTEIILNATNTYKKIIFANSLGAEDMVLHHIINDNKFNISIITLDTGRLHNETYELHSTANKLYENKIISIFPEKKLVEDYVNSKGINDFYNSLESRKECCRIRKIEPLKEVLSKADAWITGLRSDQSITRKENKIIEKDLNFGLDKISPLLDWSENEIWSFIKINNIPYNKLHDQFYPSIGCAPCTRAISIGEDIRSGRWWWENPQHKECGLHNKEN
ncbi:MAG: phosphoadenylyl-sulfate reductase [Nitrosomonadales bacterium]